MAEEVNIVITKSELRNPQVEDMLMAQQAAKRQLSPAERAPVETSFWMNPVFYTAAAGLTGAFLAWASIEPFATDSTSREERGVVLLVMLVAVPAMIDPANPLGFLTPGIVFILISSRAIAWTIVGAGMGVGPGVALKSKKLLLNGLVGGLLGGFLGGLLFDPIGFSLTKLGFEDSGGASRMIGFCTIGMMVGVFIGLIENLTKDAWLIMKTGPLRGKQFVVYHNPTIIGSSPKCDVYIFKDPAVEPHHAELRQLGSKFEILDKGSPQGVFVNSQRVTKKILEKGDIIIIGESLLEFQQKDRS
jgi:hypothetical protein